MKHVDLVEGAADAKRVYKAETHFMYSIPKRDLELLIEYARRWAEVMDERVRLEEQRSKEGR